MKHINKITITLSPTTTGLVYLGLKQLQLHFDVLKFKDGSLRVTVDDLNLLSQYQNCTISAYIQSMDDLMVVAQIKDIIKRHKPEMFMVFGILSPSYSRYDRVMLEDKNDGFGSLVFANFINSIGFDLVNTYDCHSEVMVDQINHCFDIPQQHLVEHLIGTNTPTISPDKGAVKKNPKAEIIYNKVRDLSTGKIVGVEKVKGEFDDSYYTLVDDLCEGGGTFLGVMNTLKLEDVQPSGVDLYITHGLFTNNAIEKLLTVFDNIYVYIMTNDVYNSLTKDQLDRVKPNLVISLGEY